MSAYRHELKYLLSETKAKELELLLRKSFRLDPNAGETGYMIRSLYFDDVWDSAYSEKDAGIYARKKYRIRIYNCSDAHISLERKKKEGNYIYKESAKLSRDEVNKILEGQYKFLLKRDDQLCREFYIECVSNAMRPRVIVDYDRVPYIYDAGTVRITFDRHIRAGIGSFDIFDEKLPTIETMEEGQLIMEVKYTELLPEYVRTIIQPDAASCIAASKYVLCYDATKYLNGFGYYRNRGI